MPMSLENKIERFIVRKLLRSLLSNGFSVKINDGEEDVTKQTSDFDTAWKAMFSTDEDIIKTYNADGKRGWIKLIYGNDGDDVISDYTTSLDWIIQPIYDWIETDDFLETEPKPPVYAGKDAAKESV